MYYLVMIDHQETKKTIKRHKEYVDVLFGR